MKFTKFNRCLARTITIAVIGLALGSESGDSPIQWPRASSPCRFRAAGHIFLERAAFTAAQAMSESWSR
ncbi:MAG TPA: hypothetical protein VIE89_06785 [Candidatus Binatia bacterium]|jgi:hypothetical protein